jgi:hypothetical protein
VAEAVTVPTISRQHHAPAADDQRLSGHEARLFRQQDQHRVGDVLAAADPTKITSKRCWRVDADLSRSVTWRWQHDE